MTTCPGLFNEFFVSEHECKLSRWQKNHMFRWAHFSCLLYTCILIESQNLFDSFSELRMYTHTFTAVSAVLQRAEVVDSSLPTSIEPLTATSRLVEVIPHCRFRLTSEWR